MISTQPIQLAKYLGGNENYQNHKIKQLFYLSWEDALWDLLEKKKVRKGSRILVPDFFCGGVEDNIRLHGYKIGRYPVDKYLVTKHVYFAKKIKEYKPKVIVIFHAVGIKNNLFLDKKWLKLVNNNTILIEDCVHRIVNPKKIKILFESHVIINSLRKVVPLQGCSIYGTSSFLNYSEPPFFRSLFYSIKVHLYWILMIFLWELSHFFWGSKISSDTALMAEKIMIKGYDVIGRSKLPAKGFHIFNLLQKHINLEKIYGIKQKQVELYESNLHKLLPIETPYRKSDKKEMRAWPIVLDIKHAYRVLGYLRKKGLIVRFELDDSIWSKKQKIIYLPLGPHINNRQQLSIINIVKNSLLLINNS